MKRILAVDDDESILMLYRTVLSREGYEVHFAHDRTEGMERFCEIKPDLVLLDYELPGGCGDELCEICRKQDPVPVIFISGHDEQIFCDVLKQSGVLLLKKPFTRNQLLAAVKNAMAQK
jgi:DNA-binding response OmpR family regulator